MYIQFLHRIFLSLRFNECFQKILSFIDPSYFHGSYRRMGFLVNYFILSFCTCLPVYCYQVSISSWNPRQNVRIRTTLFHFNLRPSDIPSYTKDFMKKRMRLSTKYKILILIKQYKRGYILYLQISLYQFYTLRTQIVIKRYRTVMLEYRYFPLSEKD